MWHVTGNHYSHSYYCYESYDPQLCTANTRQAVMTSTMEV